MVNLNENATSTRTNPIMKIEKKGTTEKIVKTGNSMDPLKIGKLFFDTLLIVYGVNDIFCSVHKPVLFFSFFPWYVGSYVVSLIAFINWIMKWHNLQLFAHIFLSYKS